jgi:hypothetical protein
MLERLAARSDDRQLQKLMWLMVERGQAANRKGDQEDVAKFQAAYDIYHAEAVRRGLTD